MRNRRILFFFVIVITYCAISDSAYARFDCLFLHLVVPISEPVLQIVPETIAVRENEPVTIKLTVDNPNPGSYIFSVTPVVENTALGAFTGIFKFIPDFVQAGEYQFFFTARNGEQRITKSAIVTVQDNNRLPDVRISFSDTMYLKENETAQIQITAIDPDTDNTLTYSVDPPLDNLMVNEMTGGIVFHPDFSQAGIYSLNFLVSDGHDVVTLSRTIEVDNVNRLPELILNPAKGGVLPVGQEYNLLALATDLDNDALILNAEPLPANSTFDPASGRFSFTPHLDQFRERYTVNFSVNDPFDVINQPLTWTIDAQVSPIFEFNRDGDFQGWRGNEYTDFLDVENGVLKGISTGNDPILIKTGLNIDTFSQNELVIRALVNTASPIDVFFITSEGDYVGPATIPVTNESALVTYSVDFQNLFPSPKFIETLRIDPGFVNNVFQIDFIGFNQTGIPTRTPTPDPSSSPTPSPTPSATPTPLDATPEPTFTLTPTPSATPTPIPTIVQYDFDQHQALQDSFEVLTPNGFQPAEVFVSEAPDLKTINGNAIAVRAKPGEGTFLLSKETFSRQKNTIILDMAVLAGPGKPAFALIGLNSPIDGQLAYHLVQDEAIAPGIESRLSLIYQPPQTKFRVALQVANIPDCTEEVSVLFDNLRILQLDMAEDIESGQFISEIVPTLPDGSFDGDLSTLMMNINLVNGSVQKSPISGENKAIQLSVDSDENAANVGVVFQNAMNLLPGVFYAEVFTGRFIGAGGTMGLALGNGKHTLVVFEDASALPYYPVTRRTILGGNFETGNPALSPIAIVQHAGMGEETSVYVDNLTIRRISSRF